MRRIHHVDIDAEVFEKDSISRKLLSVGRDFEDGLCPSTNRREANGDGA
jgi:hypothetical protein